LRRLISKNDNDYNNMIRERREIKK